MANSSAAQYLIAHLPDILYRDVLQDLVTLPDRIKVESDPKTGALYIESHCPIHAGTLVLDGRDIKRVETFKRRPNTWIYDITLSDTGLRDDPSQPILNLVEVCTIKAGDIANYTDTKPLETTIGRVMVNYMLFAEPFGAILPYLNKPLKGGEIEAALADALVEKRITVEAFYRYCRNLNYFAHSPEFVAPNLTPKALVTDPNVPKRKAELIAKLKDRLEAGDVTAMAEIEKELVQMDKDWLKDDPSMRFMLKGKYFTNVRKKLLLVHGAVGNFGDESQFSFVPNSLEEGWTQEAFPVISNEIRRGSYARARETAKGGEESKFLLRVFQNTRIIAEDCKTKRGLPVPVGKHNVEEYMYRNFFADDGSIDTVTEDNLGKLVGKTVSFRSPMYCTAKGGFCYVCMGKLMQNLDQKVMATAVNAVGSSFLASALAVTHNSGVSVTELKDINEYIVR